MIIESIFRYHDIIFYLVLIIYNIDFQCLH